MTLVLETNRFRVTCPQVVLQQPQRQTVGSAGKGSVQHEATPASGPAHGTAVLGSGMLREIKGGRVLNDQHRCVVAAALHSALAMGRKDGRRGDVLRTPEALSSLGSSPGASGLRHPGSRVGTELRDHGCKTPSEAAITDVCRLTFANSPVRWIWKRVESCHTGVSLPTPVSPVDLWVMDRALCWGRFSCPAIRPVAPVHLTPPV